jgi:hypothetical protein
MHLIELIRMNYTYSLMEHISVNIKMNIIETLIMKHFSQIVFSLETIESLNIFSAFIVDLCTLTNDMKFYERFIKLLFILHNDFKLLILDGDKTKAILTFQKCTISNIYNKLSNTFQGEKILLLNKKIYSFLKVKTDIPLLVSILNLFKNFVINKDFELFFNNSNPCYRSNTLPSQVVINYIVKNKKVKKVYENFKSKKINIYEPYIVFKHDKIFDYLILLINQDETNTFICEDVIDLLNILLKNMFFYKSIKFEKLINVVIEIDDIKKYGGRQRFIDMIIEILINSSSHLNKPKQHLGDNLVIDVNDDTLRDRIIVFTINSIKSFINILKNLIINYRKLVIVSTNFNQEGKNCVGTSQSIPNSIQLNYTSGIIYNNNKSININNITEHFEFNIGTNNIVNIQSNNSISFKYSIYYLKRFLYLLSIYLTTCQTKKLNEYIIMVVDIFYEIRNFLYYKTSLAISMLNFIYSVKELIINCGEEIIIKIIFLILNVGWPGNENEYLKVFTEHFNIKFKKFDSEKIRIIDKFMKREYVNLLADICCIYFVEKSNQEKILLSVFNALFKGKDMRESVFLDLIKW